MPHYVRPSRRLIAASRSAVSVLREVLTSTSSSTWISVGCLAASADAKAAAYVEADVGDEAFWGVGIHGSILTASLRAIVNAANRAEAARRIADAAVEAFDGV